MTLCRLTTAECRFPKCLLPTAYCDDRNALHQNLHPRRRIRPLHRMRPLAGRNRALELDERRRATRSYGGARRAACPPAREHHARGRRIKPKPAPRLPARSDRDAYRSPVHQTRSCMDDNSDGESAVSTNCARHASTGGWAAVYSSYDCDRLPSPEQRPRCERAAMPNARARLEPRPRREILHFDCWWGDRTTTSRVLENASGYPPPLFRRFEWELSRRKPSRQSRP